SAAVSLMTSTGKWHFSSHSAALGAMRSLANVSAVSWMAACSSVSAKCMGVSRLFSFKQTVIPGLVPGIQPPACARASGPMDHGDKHRDDSRMLGLYVPPSALQQRLCLRHHPLQDHRG